MVSTRSQRSKELADYENAVQQSIKSNSKPRRSKKVVSGHITKHKKSLKIHTTGQSTRIAVQQTKTTYTKTVRRTSRSLKLVLTGIRYLELPPNIQQRDYRLLRQQRRLQNFKGQYWPPLLLTYDNRYQFKFDHNPFQHTEFIGPSHSDQENVYELIKKDLKDNFNIECFLDQPDATTNELQGGPMHMTDDLTIDNLVKVVLSISTENSLAIRQHAQLCSMFTYTVYGKELKGTVPNYHKMRLCSPEDLVKALNIAGHHNIRQRAFHSLLQVVYRENVKRLQPGEVIQEGNLINAEDFVPGLLSMEYLRGEGLSKQARFDMLVQFEQIAVKTGCCLLAFNLKIPVFVVDTHVHNMVRALGWIPADCLDADKACMFLDNVMNDKLKFGLHQAFWHHRINCARCMPRANPNSQAYQQRVCPLEDLLSRDLSSIRRVATQPRKNRTMVKTEEEVTETRTVTKLAASVKFQNMHHTVAREKGYELRKNEIDDDFGDGSRQNKSTKADFYWSLKEFTHANDVVTVEEALTALGICAEDYEARFARKAKAAEARQLAGPKRKRSSKPKKSSKAQTDIDMPDAQEYDDFDDTWDRDLLMIDNDDSDDSDYAP